MIIGISGKQCAGKDTLANALIDKFAGRRFAFADKLKEMLRRDIYELTGEFVDPWTQKGEPLGPMLQFLGTEVMRRYRDSIWVDYLFERVLAPFQADKPWSAAIITDMRFPNEADAVRERGGFLIRLERDEEKRLADVRRLYGEKGLAREGHASETALDGYANWHLVLEDLPRNQVGDVAIAQIAAWKQAAA